MSIPRERGASPSAVAFRSSTRGYSGSTDYFSTNQGVSPISSSNFQLSRHSYNTPTVQETNEALRHMQKTERIVRLEIQRRSLRDAIRIHDEMCQELDDQLAYVADFKAEWIAHMKSLELDRQDVVMKESYARNQMDGEWYSSLEALLSSVSSVMSAKFGRMVSGKTAAGGGVVAASTIRR